MTMEDLLRKLTGWDMMMDCWMRTNQSKWTKFDEGSEDGQNDNKEQV